MLFRYKGREIVAHYCFSTLVNLVTPSVAGVIFGSSGISAAISSIDFGLNGTKALKGSLNSADTGADSGKKSWNSQNIA